MKLRTLSLARLSPLSQSIRGGRWSPALEGFDDTTGVRTSPGFERSRMGYRVPSDAAALVHFRHGQLLSGFPGTFWTRSVCTTSDGGFFFTHSSKSK